LMVFEDIRVNPCASAFEKPFFASLALDQSDVAVSFGYTRLVR